VDKIVGPWQNLMWARLQEKWYLVFVGIEMMPGPSEILVCVIGKTDPDWIARLDLFSSG